jgi:DNA-binding MarR family transcriptional regulator
MNEQVTMDEHPDDRLLQHQLQALVRAWGLHRPEATPCGQPVSVAEAYALQALQQGGPLAQHDLAAQLQLEKSTVSRLAGQLVAREWVQRTRDPADGRVLLLALTDAGQRIASTIEEARREKFARVLAAIPLADRARVLDALHILVEAMRDQS